MPNVMPNLLPNDVPAAAPPTAPGHWLAVACAEHVRRGRAGGFMQVCHGRAAPLARVRPGDRVAYYSPTTRLGGRDALQAFTAIGVVRPGAPYQADMGDGFRPFRRNVWWLEAAEAAIRPLVGQLDFTAGPHWGYRLRAGLVAIGPEDMRRIAAAMDVAVPD